MTDHVLRPQAPGIPLPVPSAVSAPYWDGCAARELRYLRCADCDEILMPPTAAICWRCLGRDVEWLPSAGTGVVRSWTVVWRPPSPGLEAPYAPAVVAFDEGFDHVTAIVGCTVSELRVGMPVAVEFALAGEGVLLPYVRPTG